MFITALISRPPSPGGKLRCGNGATVRFVRLGQGAREFGVGAVAGLDRDDVSANGAAEQREVADDIEDFVPDEFIWETQRLLAQDGIAAHDDGVLQAAALDQVFLHQRLDVLVINKGAGRRDFASRKSPA